MKCEPKKTLMEIYDEQRDGTESEKHRQTIRDESEIENQWTFNSREKKKVLESEALRDEAGGCGEDRARK